MSCCSPDRVVENEVERYSAPELTGKEMILNKYLESSESLTKELKTKAILSMEPFIEDEDSPYTPDPEELEKRYRQLAEFEREEMNKRLAQEHRHRPSRQPLRLPVYKDPVDPGYIPIWSFEEAQQGDEPRQIKKLSETEQLIENLRISTANQMRQNRRPHSEGESRGSGGFSDLRSSSMRSWGRLGVD